MFIPEKEGDRG